MMPLLSIIVPTYNEIENLPTLLKRVKNALHGVDFEMIIVDDDSPDGTADLAEDLRKNYDFLKVVRRENERGLATAVIEGFKNSEGQVLTVMDADLQHPPEKIIELLNKIREGADIVVGSRYIPGGEIENWTFKRKFYSKGARAIAHLLLPKSRKAKDPLSGFFMLRREVLDGAELRPIGYKILLEILIRGNYKKVEEVPITFKDRERGTSSLVFKEYSKYSHHLLRLSWEEGEIMRFVKFGLVGGSGVLVNLGLLWLITERFGMFYLFSASIAIELSILSNFILNDLWTFHDRGKKGMKNAFRRFLKFNLISSPAFPMQLGIMGLLKEFFGYYYMWAAFIAIVIVFIWNFAANNLWTWFK
ncbi:MAG: glycosyltransferase family 2 protein [Candidatus Thermoplasmatota archaeon]|nr:glycosyltransferase family 2 protein [Candidatus Thermoplasmatota archaeon]